MEVVKNGIRCSKDIGISRFGAPPLTAAGEVSTASKWKMLRLSLRLLYWLFSHGENFQSATYGDNIRRECDFLIELSNTLNIEYAGKGFGHAILTI